MKKKHKQLTIYNDIILKKISIYITGDAIELALEETIPLTSSFDETQIVWIMTTDSLPDPESQKPCDVFPELGIDIVNHEGLFYILVYDSEDLANIAPVDCLFEGNSNSNPSESIFLIDDTESSSNLINDFTDLICGFIDCACDFKFYPSIIENTSIVSNFTLNDYDLLAYTISLLAPNESNYGDDYDGNIWTHVFTIPIYNLDTCIAAGYDISIAGQLVVGDVSSSYVVFSDVLSLTQLSDTIGYLYNITFDTVDPVTGQEYKMNYQYPHLLIINIIGLQNCANGIESQFDVKIPTVRNSFDDSIPYSYSLESNYFFEDIRLDVLTAGPFTGVFGFNYIPLITICYIIPHDPPTSPPTIAPSPPPSMSFPSFYIFFFV